MLGTPLAASHPGAFSSSAAARESAWLGRRWRFGGVGGWAGVGGREAGAAAGGEPSRRLLVERRREGIRVAGAAMEIRSVRGLGLQMLRSARREDDGVREKGAAPRAQDRA